MEFTNAQIRDFAGSDEQYEKAKRLVDEQRIVSLDIDDFSSRETKSGWFLGTGL